MSQNVPTHVEKKYEVFKYANYPLLLHYQVLLSLVKKSGASLNSLPKVEFERKEFSPEDLKKIQDEIFGKLIKFLMEPIDEANSDIDEETNLLKTFVRLFDYKKYYKNVFELLRDYKKHGKNADLANLANRIFTQGHLIKNDDVIPPYPKEDEVYIKRLEEIGQILVNISEVLVYLEAERSRVDFFEEFDKTDNPVKFLEDLAQELGILKGQKVIPVNIYENEVQGVITHFTKKIREGLTPVVAFYAKERQDAEVSKNSNDVGSVSEQRKVGHINTSIGTKTQRAEILLNRGKMLENLKESSLEVEPEAGEEDTTEVNTLENPDVSETAPTIEIENLLDLNELSSFIESFTEIINQFKQDLDNYCKKDEIGVHLINHSLVYNFYEFVGVVEISQKNFLTIIENIEQIITSNIFLEKSDLAISKEKIDELNELVLGIDKFCTPSFSEMIKTDSLAFLRKLELPFLKDSNFSNIVNIIEADNPNYSAFFKLLLAFGYLANELVDAINMGKTSSTIEGLTEQTLSQLKINLKNTLTLFSKEESTIMQTIKQLEDNPAINFRNYNTFEDKYLLLNKAFFDLFDQQNKDKAIYQELELYYTEHIDRILKSRAIQSLKLLEADLLAKGVTTLPENQLKCYYVIFYKKAHLSLLVSIMKRLEVMIESKNRLNLPHPSSHTPN